MPRSNRETDKQFDAIVAELEPVPVETAGPVELELDAHDLLDGLEELGTMPGVGPATLAKMAATDVLIRTARGAIEWGRQQAADRVAAYAGLCLMFVRLCFNVGPLYPDAWSAWVNAERKRRCTPEAAERGHAGFFRGGAHGHVVLCLGNGRCLSNDTGKPGTINVAMIRDIEAAWGYVFVGTTSDLNGEAPVPRVRASKPRVTDRQWRINYLRRALRRARVTGDTARVRRIRRWLTAILNR